MVYMTRILGYAKHFSNSPRKYLRSGVLDVLPLKVKAGSGGSGLPRYGGIGGQGGSVYIKAKENMDLTILAKQLRNKIVVAGLGCNSQKNGIIGKPGNDVYINVPTGVSVKTTRGICLGEVNEPESTLMVAKGGLGGNKDNGFCGQKGQMHTIILDLKLIADVALVGFPNAGKSSLLKAVSGAKTKIANYPFTTVKPHVGILQYEDDRTIKMADLPGVIEGAHANIGMGHKFLKHIERCKMMIFVVDIQGFSLSYKYSERSCLDTIVLLNKEIELYNADLLNIPAMLILNKMDTANAQEIYKTIKPQINNLQQYVQQCDDKFKPERIVQFEKIITTSLLQKTEQDIRYIKESIRKLIDDIDRSKEKYNDLDSDLKLNNELNERMRQYAPNLV